ncbi:pali-domain-containing protein [Pisolithus marmoratus]|nr:pali-domain-containing protein [Pisolithus marmoratus]
MRCMRPATPGFIVTFVAAILLAVVSFSVPLIKSVYFLKASLTVENVDGTITFGTLGYCMTISGSTSCSAATVGYEFDINALVGDNSSLQIPTIVIKWLTYALVLHIVAFGLAGGAALFGLLAHVREMAMSCFSSCISGFGATIAFIAFIFDLVVFFVAKSRMNSVSGGSASIGNAVWLTLVAALLLFFSGCFYGIGRCCIKRRGRDMWGGQPNDAANGFGNREQVRLDAVKAEADRKARLAQGETGLPAFQEYEQFQPLKAKMDGDEVYLDDEAQYRDNYSHHRPQSGYSGSGYAPAPVGSRAIDELNNAPSYPPQPRRRGSTQTQVTASSYYSSHPPSSHTPAPTIPPSIVSAPASSLSPVHEPSPTNYYTQDPYGVQAYGHATGNNAYVPADNSYFNPYGTRAQSHYAEPSQNVNIYNTGYAAGTVSQSSPPRAPYDAYGPVGGHEPERNYTPGGGAYGASAVPTTRADDPYGVHQNLSRTVPRPTASPPTADTNFIRPPTTAASPVSGPRGPRTSIVLSPPTTYNESPPEYEAGLSGMAGQWGRKG